MARPEKTAAVAEIVESFNGSAGAVLTEYRGLTVKELQDLRRSLGENANYAVVKNTLTKIADRGGRRGFRRPAHRSDRHRLHQRRRGRGGQGSA
jgi:ribosomal protein L10